MIDFSFYSPTEFVFGRKTEQQTGTLAKRYGATKLMIIYGGGSAVKSGLIDRVQASLSEAGVEYVTLSGVRPNPTEDKVREGVALARENKVDFILAVGGGSVIDTAKSIAAAVDYDGDFWDFYIGKAKVTSALPVGVVLTIPAAGSEGSGNAVITNMATGQKLGIKEPMLLRPKFAVMNPELTMTLPAWHTASGICDMIVHILERYFSNTENVEISDRLCEGVIIAIINEARKVMKNPQDYDARANIMWSGTIAHNGTCGIGREEDWAGHQMEHEISAMYDVTHGAGLAVVTPAYMLYMADHHPARIQQFAERVFGVSDAKEGVRLFKQFLHDDLGLPITLQQLLPNLSEEEIQNAIPQFVANLHKNKGNKFGAFYPITPEVTTAVMHLAME
ncbi:MAG: iron-containing alcohol dehydrogenase [Prevotella sp.]|nr:iron-containing alcohol dehydrogenase [Prevotella sp.]